MKRITALAVSALLCSAAHAQTIDDGIMMGKRLLCAGYMYTHDGWNEYWEGTLKRTNANLGTLTTEAHQIYAIYGVTNSLNVITSIPHVRTNASKGVLAGMRGFQDGTFAVKYKFFDTPLSETGTLRTIAVVSGSVPLSEYTPDFLPMSIGTRSRRISARMTAHLRTNKGWFVNGTAAYTWRGDIALDRPYFYTDGHLTLSDQVPLPRVFDYSLSSGYIRGELVLSVMFGEQRTQGGGDIRRNDMPFVSNRMNFSRVGAWAKVPLPGHDALSIVGGYSYVLAGRNVGQSTTLTAGLMYLFSFRGNRNR
ncbi:MAG TPA: hypothetical protein VES20_24785 [Bryobacteraceae bacterium]|nr:hypothetical protein [Bryobacteraceae bacterium]